MATPIQSQSVQPMPSVIEGSAQLPQSFSISDVIWNLAQPILDLVHTWIRPPHKGSIEFEHLKHFAEWLKNPSTPIPKESRSLCGHCFSSKSIAHLRATARTYAIALSSLAPAQRFAAPMIIRDISTQEIPWELLSLLIHKQPLSDFQKKHLHQWIDALEAIGDLLSPTLLLSLLEVAVHTTFPQHTEEEQSLAVFELADQLQNMGLTYRTRAEEALLNDEDSQYQFSDQLHIALPARLHIFAFAIQNQPHIMAITSASPLHIGQFFSAQKRDTSLPYLRCHTLEPRGRFLICDRIISSMANYTWDNEETNTAVLDSIVRFIRQLLSLHVTPILTANDIFLTANHSLSIITTPASTSYFCLHTIEKLIHTLCQHNNQRIREVYTSIAIAIHPSTSWYSAILRDDMLYSPEEHIASLALQMGFAQTAIPSAQKWIKKIQTMHTIIMAKLADLHIWKNTSPARLRKAFCQSLLRLQSSSFTLFSEDFTQHILDDMNCNQKLMQGTLFVFKDK